MIWIWQGVKLGEVSTPTLKEMRVVKRDLNIKNPMTFLSRATAIMEPVPQWRPDGEPILEPVTGPDGKPVVGDDGKPKTKQVVKMEPGEQFDFECFAMLIAIMMTRQGTPTEMEDVDGNIATDLRMELTAAERAKAAEAAGKAGVSAVEVARALGPTETPPATT